MDLIFRFCTGTADISIFVWAQRDMCLRWWGCLLSLGTCHTPILGYNKATVPSIMKPSWQRLSLADLTARDRRPKFHFVFWDIAHICHCWLVLRVPFRGRWIMSGCFWASLGSTDMENKRRTRVCTSNAQWTKPAAHHEKLNIKNITTEARNKA